MYVSLCMRDGLLLNINVHVQIFIFNLMTTNSFEI
uniref:Uncharacterized protein n=1 Tax=Lepeophtheirus salmonis TaxID=72036 RepID=A0A0K2UDE0_LEPSM